MINAVHIDHRGVNKTLSRAKDVKIWPSIGNQITDHVLACQSCLTHRHLNSKEPLKPQAEVGTPSQVYIFVIFFRNKHSQ
jgi:hypothetical protein